MTEDEPAPDGAADGRADASTADGTGTEPEPDSGGEPATDIPDRGTMRARIWTIAAAFNDPADYGIPPLPEWTVYKEAGGGMALGAAEHDGVFIAADTPVTVRR